MSRYVNELTDNLKADASKSTPLMLPQQFPIALLVASGIFYVQQRSKHYLMRRQGEVMEKESYMRPFVPQHELAFNTHTVKDTAAHGLETDKGLPEEGNGLGWYSVNRLSYTEWYRISCARLAYNDMHENNPRVVFQLLIGTLKFPWVAIGAGVVYMFSSIRWTRALYQDNGIQVAKHSPATKIRRISLRVL